MKNVLFLTTISKGLNLTGFITAGYQKAANDELQKGEVTDSLRYDNNFKYTKSGKEIKSALERAKSAYQLKKDDLANQMSLLKEKLTVKPFAPLSSWNMRGFDKQLGLQFNYPYEFFSYIDNGSGDLQKYPPRYSIDDCCTGINKRFSCSLKTEHFPTTTEEAEPYYAYNRLLDDYISQAVDILQLNIMIKNLNDKKSFELSQNQMMALDQYMDEPADNLEKGEETKFNVGDTIKFHGHAVVKKNKTIGTAKQEGEITHAYPDGHYDVKNSRDFIAKMHPKENHFEKSKEIKEDNLKKAYEALGFDEDLNDIEKADNEGGDSKAIMHTNGGDPVDVSDLIMTNGNDHFVDVIDPATGKPRFKSGDKVKYKLEDDDAKYKGTVTEEKHPTYDDKALKIKHNNKKEVTVG